MRTVQSNYTTWALDQGVSLHNLLVLAGAVGDGLVLLDRVPQLGTVAVWLRSVAGDHHHLAHDALLARVAVLDAGTPVQDALGGAVRRGGRGRASLPARYDLAAEMLACHRAASFRAQRETTA